MDDHMRAELVWDTLQAAVATRGVTRMDGTIFHSDRGVLGGRARQDRRSAPCRSWSTQDRRRHASQPGDGQRRCTRVEGSDIEDLTFEKKSVFLSHNRADRPFVHRISRKLRKRRVPYWLDEAEILPGDSLIEKIAAGITEIDYLLCFISEDSIKSSWVRKEISIALTREIEVRQVRVVPAMIGNVQDEQIPSAISDKYYLDFRSNAPFEKAMHELLMLLDEGYATFVSRLVEMLDEPPELNLTLEGTLMAGGFDVKGLGGLSWYYGLYKSMGLEIDELFECTSTNQTARWNDWRGTSGETFPTHFGIDSPCRHSAATPASVRQGRLDRCSWPAQVYLATGRYRVG
jgi:hypothetical protein